MTAPDAHRGVTVLEVEPLTAAAFAPFGEVIQTADAATRVINAGSTLRFHDLCRIDTGPEGRALFNIFRASPLALPIDIRALEKHPLGSQAFMPLNQARFLVVVAEPVARPQTRHLRAFVTDGRQGVNYRRDTWHHFVLALDAVTDFVVIDRDGPGANCDEIALDEAVRLRWPAV